MKELAHFSGISFSLLLLLPPLVRRCCRRRHSPALLFEFELKSCYLWLILILLQSIKQNISDETLYAPHLGLFYSNYSQLVT